MHYNKRQVSPLENRGKECKQTQFVITVGLGVIHIATTHFSPELNSLDWGGSIIGKTNHTTTTTKPPLHHVMTFCSV